MRRLSFLPVALLLWACQGTPPPVPVPLAPKPAPPAPKPTPVAARVLLISLDGAPAETLHQLYDEGKLDAGGFARFFREGQVAEAIVPVNPTLTSPNHISLATGYPASATGIVSNRFHPPNAPWTTLVSGFDAPIGTDTLWEAARRQGKRVGSVTWPGLDLRDDRRKADWGMVYTQPDRPSALVYLTRKDWTPAEIPRGLPFAASYAPILSAHVDIPGDPAKSGLDLFALDSADDGITRYDRLLAVPRPAIPGASEEILAPGQWLHVPPTPPTPLPNPLPDAAPIANGRPAGLWMKVLAISPTLNTVQLYFGSANHTRAYPEPFAASLAEAGLDWPGPPDERRLQATWQGQQGIGLDTWAEQTERFAAFFGACVRLAAARSDWDLLLAYFPVIDYAGHALLLTDPRQPGYSPERSAALAAGRLRAWKAVDRELARLLSEIDLATTRVVVVSDHGMAPVHTVLDPNVLLLGRKYLAADAQGKILPDKTAVFAVSDGGLSHLYLAPKAAADPAQREKLVGELRALFDGWTVDGVHPLARVLTRREAAEVGLDHPNSGDLLLFALPGYTFEGSGNLRELKERRAAGPTLVYGMHGYLNTNPEMRGIYMALGAGLQPGTSSAVPSIEVAGRIAAWLGIEKPRRQPVTPGLPGPR